MLYSSWLVPDLGGNIHNFLRYHFANNIFDSSEIDFDFYTPTILQDLGKNQSHFVSFLDNSYCLIEVALTAKVQAVSVWTL